MSISVLGCILIIALKGVTIKDTVPQFKTAGEQEAYWDKEIFERPRSNRSFTKFEGAILETGNFTLKYGNQTIILSDTSAFTRGLFKSGLLYPSLMGATCAPEQRVVVAKADSSVERFAWPDSCWFKTFTVLSVEELKSLEQQPGVKRFTMWVHWQCMANPVVYLFELTNGYFDKKNNLSDFMKGAVLTFFCEARIII